MRIAVAGLIVLACAGCAKYGYTNRVLHRVASPRGNLLAVCQEVPVLDGPEFDVRLETKDGKVIRKLFGMGDGGRCSEVVWSQDGRRLAVLTSHVATITVVDVEWALSHPTELERHWFTRQFSFSSERSFTFANELSFASPLELEFQLCEYSLVETQRNRGQITCSKPPYSKRMEIPDPLVVGQPS